MATRIYTKRELLMEHPKDKWLDYIEGLCRNFLTAHTGWLTNISTRYGMDIAAELNALVWLKYTQVEVYRLRSFFNLGDDSESMEKCIALSTSTPVGTKKFSKRELLIDLTEEKLLGYIDIFDKNFWTFQNNWMLHVNQRYGTEVATELDVLLWSKYGPDALRRAKELFDYGDDMQAFQKYKALQYGPADSTGLITELSDRKARFLTLDCAIQIQRQKENLGELPCKLSLEPQSKAEAAVINPKIKVTRTFAPPDPHPGQNAWCEVVWEIED